MAKEETIEQLAMRLGGKWLIEGAPDNEIPAEGMPPLAARRLIGEEMILDGIPERNLATFVTTWMEPEAQEIIADILDRNFIDHGRVSADGRDRTTLASACSPASSTLRARPPAPAPRGRRRRSCSGLCR